MPASPGGQITTTRERRPGWHGDGANIPITAVRNPEQSGCGHRQWTNPRVTDELVAVTAGKEFYESPITIGTKLTPIQCRMGIENLQTTHQEQCETDRIDPMGHSGGELVAIDNILGTRLWRCDCR